jgi:hypothetical protein
MTLKLTRKTPSFRGLAPFIGGLTVMIALAALVQTPHKRNQCVPSPEA